MEQNTLAAEDSVDSIPGPVYERIVGATSLAPSAETNHTQTNGVVVAEEEMDDDEGSDMDGDEDEEDEEELEDGQALRDAERECPMEDDYGERDDYKENESNLEQKALNILEGVAVAAAAATGQIIDNVTNSATTTATTTLMNQTSKSSLDAIVDNKSAVVVTDAPATDAISCPVPIQLVSAVALKPKMVPMKTKSNKLIMVQLVNEQPAEDGSATGIISLTDQSANGSNAPNMEAPDACKPHSPNDDKSPNMSQQQQQNSRFLARSSTPLSREFLALQRSVNESKVLSEFVTDTVRKRQKSAPKDANEQPAPQQHYYHHYQHHHHHPHGEKHRKPGKLAPLKDDGGCSSSSTLQRRSRSKSVNRKSIDGIDTAGGKLKRWPSDEKMLKRTNMRSQNSEFVQKQIEFLNRVKHDEGEVSSETEDGERSFVNGTEDDELHLTLDQNTMNDSNVSAAGLVGSTSSLLDASLDRVEVVGGNNGILVNVDSVVTRLMSYWAPPPKRGWDSFCWKCRECIDIFPCSKCVRCFHCTCIKVTAATKLDDSWICPECMNVENVLNGPKRSSRRSEVSLDLLSQLLSFALKRMKMVKGYSKFLYTDEDLLHYSKYIVNPVTFTTLQEKVEKRAFRCSEEFLNETKWILHNALILSSNSSSKEVFTAKSILKVCRQEANEIDTCGECYLNANTRTDWFVDVCAQPHLLLWAKLKGFPYWPAKAMGPGQGLSHVNVRFFGEHDRAFVPVKDCFLYSEQDPNTQTGKRSARELADCIKEVELHIEKIRAKVGAFKYAKFKTPYEPAEEMQQMEMMIPGVMDYMKRQQALVSKPSLQYKIVKTADNHLSIIKKASTTESGNDSDHSGSPNKKSINSASAGCAGGIGSVSEVKPSAIAPKYEVVNKANSDDSNSSKVTAVILKRKPSNDRKKEVGEDLELPMPKMIKFDEEEDEHKQLAGTKTFCSIITSGSSATSKRKHGADDGGASANTSSSSGSGSIKGAETERHRTKHARHEPRVPMITIKTNINALTCAVGETKAIATISPPNTHKKSSTAKVSAEVKTATVSVKEEVVTHAPMSPPTNNAQTMMENLVKNKHGVTIKKISKETTKKTADESTKLTEVANETPEETQLAAQPGAENTVTATDAASEAQMKNGATDGKINSSEINNASGSKSCTPKREENKKSVEKSEENRHILKDLVPFVEIKKEITSDDEADMQMVTSAGIQGSKQPSTDTCANEKAATAASVVVPPPKTSTVTDTQAPLATITAPIIQPNLLLVKKEVMSDEEDKTTVSAANNVTASTSGTPQPLSTAVLAAETSSGTQSTTATPPTLPDAVRVGDTMIQRVNTKNVRNLQPSLVALKSPTQVAQEAAAAMDAATAVAAAMHVSPPNKRSNTRGVPYGPLPASAIAQPQMQLQKSTVTPSNTVGRATIQQQQNQPSQTQQPVQAQVQAQPLHLPQQRARKSFPNRGTPDISPARINFPAAPLPSPSLPPPPSTSPLATSNDLKRTLLKNSMVSIPRQAWSPHDAQRSVVVGNSNSNGSTNAQSIPVPPLTAVSKTPIIATSLSDTSNATNANINNNIFGNPNSSVNVTINTTPIATPFVTCNGNIGPNGPALLTPLSMSAPPPLAGLSQSSTNILPSATVASMTVNLPLMVNNSSSVGSGSGSSSLSSIIELPTQQMIAAASSTSGILASTPNGELVTPSLAAMVTDAICRGPPKMVQRPNGPLQSDGSTMFPSQAGPVCQTLVENAHKLTDFFISVMEDTMLEMSVGEEPVLQAKITLLKMELERTKQAYEHEIAELKRTSDLMLCEMRKSIENEKARIANEIRKQCDQERLRSIEETKKKQWCSNCGREAQFYCCWNTSYCDYPCQQMHWSRHSATCAQTRPTNTTLSDSLAKATNSIMTTTVSAIGQQQQQQLVAAGIGSKVSNANVMTVTTTTSMAQQQSVTHYNKNAMSNKKEKHGTTKASQQQSIASSVGGGGGCVGVNSMATLAAANATGAGTEMLKLPSNTYLRTVPQCGSAGNNNAGGGNMRNSTYSVQRVNIPLPITALVQRGNSWELTSAAPTNNAGAASLATITAPPPNASQAMTQLTSQQQQQQQQQQHQRMLSGGTSSNMSMARGNSRSRAAANAQAMQQTMAAMHNTATSGGGAASMSCGVLRPTQM